jgi:hypothetical protein
MQISNYTGKIKTLNLSNECPSEMEQILLLLVDFNFIFILIKEFSRIKELIFSPSKTMIPEKFGTDASLVKFHRSQCNIVCALDCNVAATQYHFTKLWHTIWI